MEDKSENLTNMNIIPEYTLIKKVLLQQFYIAQLNLTQFDLKPTPNNELICRESIILLARSLSFKSYVLKDERLKKVFNDFVSNPVSFNNFNLHLVFSICHLIIELLGLLKIEQEQTIKENVYQEV